MEGGDPEKRQRGEKELRKQGGGIKRKRSVAAAGRPGGRDKEPITKDVFKKSAELR